MAYLRRFLKISASRTAYTVKTHVEELQMRINVTSLYAINDAKTWAWCIRKNLRLSHYLHASLYLPFAETRLRHLVAVTRDSLNISRRLKKRE